MEYKGLYISYIEDNGVEREIDGVVKPCEGLYFQVYADSDMQYEIGFFCGAFGIDMDNNEKSIEEYAKDTVEIDLESYNALKEQVLEQMRQFEQKQTEGSQIETPPISHELSEKRVREILNNALDWISEVQKGSELYRILRSCLGMTNEEIESEGFTLENYYEDEEDFEI